MKIAFIDDIHAVYERTAGVARLRERAHVDVFTGPFGTPDQLRSYTALVATRERTRFDAALLAQLPELKIIAQTGNHAYHIDFAATKRQGVIVAKAMGGFSIATAELTIGLMLAIMRRIPATDLAVRKGAWPRPLGIELHGKVLGIVGLGHIGSYVAKVAAAFGMRVIAWSPKPNAARAKAAGATFVDLDQLVSEADVISIHATVTDKTRRLINRDRLRRMKPTAYLVNTARAAIVDETALAEALRANAIAGAALDVFDREPLPANHPLLDLQNVVLTSHIGWPTDTKYAEFADAAADCLLAFMDGREVPQFTGEE